uniref:Uncharacterized protein n=1 Tax=Meloidogyne javanica TaxID=6303 RepID=A0A915M5K3_MELJA
MNGEQFGSALELLKSSATSVAGHNDYFWEVPEEWSLQDADM